MTAAESMAQRLATVEEIVEPWPHGIIDDFLPAEVFAELLSSLPPWVAANKTTAIPDSVRSLLTDPSVDVAIRQRFGFDGGRATIELTYRTSGIACHADRKDKLWSGIVYVAGDAVGTALFDKAGKLAKRVPFIPNRLLCWSRRGEYHSIPQSHGRFALQWWILK